MSATTLRFIIISTVVICIGQRMLMTAAAAATSIPSTNCKLPSPMDIRYSTGVQTDKIPGSRIEYLPFPSGFMITPGSSLHIEFRSYSSSGLIFLAGNFDMADMVSAYLRKGRLTFARRCGSGRAFEIYQERFDDSLWHTLTYYHNENGGTLLVDGISPFRQYRIGPCASLSAVLFGGMTSQMSAGGRFANVNQETEPSVEAKETEMAARHRFSGCLRNLRFDGKVPAVNPKYVAVSQCVST